MDYIVMSSIVGFGLLMLTISYDIACQWKINLAERNKKLPEAVRLPTEEVKLQCGLPVWHAASHDEECQNANSLSFRPGVGKSDGEGIERVWSVLNPSAFATKDAGKGQRADVLEGKIDNHNHLKNMGQGVFDIQVIDFADWSCRGGAAAQTRGRHRRTRQPDPGICCCKPDYFERRQKTVEEDDKRLAKGRVKAESVHTCTQRCVSVWGDGTPVDT
jgi:hypothetical protein